jgi:hypothetical protein
MKKSQGPTSVLSKGSPPPPPPPPQEPKPFNVSDYTKYGLAKD